MFNLLCLFAASSHTLLCMFDAVLCLLCASSFCLPLSLSLCLSLFLSFFPCSPAFSGCCYFYLFTILTKRTKGASQLVSQDMRGHDSDSLLSQHPHTHTHMLSPSLPLSPSLSLSSYLAHSAGTLCLCVCFIYCPFNFNSHVGFTLSAHYSFMFASLPLAPCSLPPSPAPSSTCCTYASVHPLTGLLRESPVLFYAELIFCFLFIFTSLSFFPFPSLLFVSFAAAAADR